MSTVDTATRGSQGRQDPAASPSFLGSDGAYAMNRTFRIACFPPPKCTCWIEGEVGAMVGVRAVLVQPVHQRVVVEYDPQHVSANDVGRRLADAGCPCPEDQECCR